MQIYEPRLKTLEHHISGLHIRTAQNPEDPSLRDFANRAIRFFGDDANNIRGEILAAVDYEYSYPLLPNRPILGSRTFDILKDYIQNILSNNREISPESYFNELERSLKYGAPRQRLRRYNAVNGFESMVNEEDEAGINIGENIRAGYPRRMDAPAVIMPPRPPGFYDRPQRQNADDASEEVNVAFGNNDVAENDAAFNWLENNGEAENAAFIDPNESEIVAQDDAHNTINQEISDSFPSAVPEPNAGLRNYARAARNISTPSR